MSCQGDRRVTLTMEEGGWKKEDGRFVMTMCRVVGTKDGD